MVADYGSAGIGDYPDSRALWGETSHCLESSNDPVVDSWLVIIRKFDTFDPG